MISTSERFKLNGTDIFKTLRGSLVVFASAFVIAGLQGVIAAIESGDFALGSLSILTPALVSGMSFILESTRRYFKSYE